MSAGHALPLPYVAEPLRDEPVDGWLAELAGGLGITASALNRHAGLPNRSSYSAVRDITDEQLAALHDRTGVPVDTLRFMTLARWASLGLRPVASQRGHGQGAWPRSRGIRVCPLCLQERDGRLRLHWYLHWSFACVTHRRVLVPIPTGDLRPATVLWRANEASTGSLAMRLPVDHPALSTQSALNRVLDQPMQLVLSLGQHRRPWEHLHDLAALTRLAASCPGMGDLPRMLDRMPDGEWWRSLVGSLRVEEERSAAKRLQQVTAHPALMAFTTHLANAVLGAEDPDAAGAALWWLTGTAREEAVHHARSRQLSWPLVRVLDDSTRRSRPARLLILRFGLARFEYDGSRRAPLDAAKVPATCWRSVAVSDDPRAREIAEVAASAALMAIGSTRGVRSALDRIGHPHLARRVRADWHRAFSVENDAAFNRLLDLHHALVDGVVPINYARRRHTISSPPDIGKRKARRIARELDVPLSERLVRHASWYVFELLTGSNILLGLPLLDLWAPHRLAYRKQRLIWDEARPRVLMEIAEQNLLRLRIDEPVAWEPIFDAGKWVLPPPASHLLSTWSDTDRAMRRGSRVRPTAPSGYALEEAVALAARGNTETARLIARNLNRFAEVAAAGSIKGGAKTLGITSGTLSVQMADLERDLATPLLDRSGLAVAPTREGRYLLRLITDSGHDLRSASAPVGSPRSVRRASMGRSSDSTRRMGTGP